MVMVSYQHECSYVYKGEETMRMSIILGGEIKHLRVGIKWGNRL